jgi:methanogenic corrinoid protein MtbC1
MGNKTKLIKLINEQNREAATVLAIKMLEEKEVSIVELYEEVLRKALYQIDCAEFDRECIWREHIKTAIVRTIIEVTYPYILKETKNIKSNGKKVLVVCPPEEYHEIGAKMVHDYFLLNGFDSTFIGANTPVEVIVDSVKYTKPDFVAISVTNLYNIVNAKKLIQRIKNTNNNIKIFAGGQAFLKEGSLEAAKADFHLKDFKSIKDLI